MLVDAVGLLLGGRASQDLVRTGEELTTVEAIFEGADGREVVVRREITAQGRSRAFVNGAAHDLDGAAPDRLGVRRAPRPARAPGAARSVHAPAVARPLGRARVRTPPRCSTAWEARHRHRGARSSAPRWTPANGPPGSSSSSSTWPSSTRPGSGRVKTTSWPRPARCCATPAGSPRSAARPTACSTTTRRRRSRTLGQVWKRVGELAAIDPAFAAHAAARDGIKAQLEDLALTLRDYQQRLDASPARLQEVEDRLALVERLKRKHGPTLDDVLAKTAALGARARSARRRARAPRGRRDRGAAARTPASSTRPDASRRRGTRRPAASPRRSNASSASWRWPGRASSCG